MEKPGEDTLVKYFNGYLEEEERKLVELYLAMDIDQDYVVSCMKKAAELDGEFVDFSKTQYLEEAWQKFAILRQHQPEPLLRNIRVWKKIAVAAAILCGVATAGIFFHQSKLNRKQPILAKTSVTTDHAPGGNKALLVLANGKTIDVNNAREGMIAKDGETMIVKTSDGSVVYHGAQDGSASVPLAMNTLVVPKGGQYNLTLPDGTKVWLNAASSLIFPSQFSGGTREVKLKGEAYFEVAKNAKRPFHVKLDRMDVEVLGTHFNIMAYDDEPSIRTTLLEGSVKLSSGSARTILKPGQEGTLIPGDKFMVKYADTDRAMAWKNGRFIFDNEDLPSISRKISRWYNISVVDEREDKALTYTGTISRYQNVSEVLKMLELTGTLHYKIENNKVIITKP